VSRAFHSHAFAALLVVEIGALLAVSIGSTKTDLHQEQYCQKGGIKGGRLFAVAGITLGP
jgi:hypothetical protein